jgi:hypothetical protein
MVTVVLRSRSSKLPEISLEIGWNCSSGGGGMDAIDLGREATAAAARMEEAKVPSRQLFLVSSSLKNSTPKLKIWCLCGWIWGYRIFFYGFGVLPNIWDLHGPVFFGQKP